MESKNILIDIVKVLKKNQIDFLIAGGVAVVLHGVERLTMDLDIALKRDEENIKKFLKVVKELKLIPRAPIPPETLLDEKKVEMIVNEKGAKVFTFIDPGYSGRQLDIFISDFLSFEKLNAFTEIVEISGEQVRILTKEKLVELKLKIYPMRDKDLFDIRELQNLINNGKK